jgi:outer membrane protein TolC
MHRLIISLLLLAVPLHPAEAQTIRLSLREAIGLAMKNNNLVKAAGFRAAASRQGIHIATSAYYPDIRFEEAFSASNAPTRTFMMKLDQGRFTQDDFQIENLNSPAAHHDFRTALTIRQPLYSPSLAPLREMAVKEADGESLGHEATRQDTAFLVFRTWLETRKAAAQLGAAEQAIAEAKENLRLAGVRGKAGVGLRSDELRAQTHLASVEQQLIRSRNNLVLARMRLAVIVGLEEGSQAEINDQSFAFPVSLSAGELTRAALESRSDLGQLRSGVEKGDASVKLARSAYLPTLEAVASYQLNARDTPFGSDNDAWQAGVSLNWQVFDGFRRHHQRVQAVDMRSAAAETLAGKEREIRFQVRESLLRAEEAGKRREVAGHAVADAEETVRLLTKRFENSLATLVELLDAQSALNQARANLADTEADYALAGGQVYYTSGIFLKEIMK